MKGRATVLAANRLAQMFTFDLIGSPASWTSDLIHDLLSEFDVMVDELPQEIYYGNFGPSIGPPDTKTGRRESR